MKRIDFFKYITLVLLIGTGFAGCDNDDDLGNPPRLFRPIASLENKNNNIIATWDNIKGATSYELDLMKITSQGDTVSFRTTTVNTSPYTFESVDWDEKYLLKIKAVGTDIESAIYRTDDLSITYPTKMTGTRSIDVSVLVQWKTDGTPFTSLKITSDDGDEPIVVNLKEEEYADGEKIVNGLKPSTSYRVYAYSGEEQSTDTYQGRLLFSTAGSENLDEKYGEGKWFDLRGYTEDSDFLLSDEMKTLLSQYDVFILEGGYKYTVTNALVFARSATFVTGLTLAGNAKFVQSGGMMSSQDVGLLKFEKIDFISDKVNDKPVSDYVAKSFDGRQVYNVNGSNTTVNEMIFKSCRIEGYRAIVRLQGANDGVRNLTFDECTINGIGDQAAVTTNNQSSGLMENITFSNSTLINIVMLADLRASKTAPKFTISDCTFCYAPIETTQNANTPLFRFGSNPVELVIRNSVFGPSLATVSSTGNDMITYQAGVEGSIMLNGTSATVAVVNSYKTNFTWATIGTSTYPVEGLESLSLNEKGLFQDPSAEEENFTIISNFSGAKTSGAIKWRMP